MEPIKNGFVEIEAPKHVHLSLKQKKATILTIVLIVAAAVSLPFIIAYFLKGEEKTASFNDLVMVSSSGGEGETNQTKFKLSFNYPNEYESDFTINSIQVKISIKAPDAPQSEWNELIISQSEQGYEKIMVQSGVYIVETYFEVTDSDNDAKEFFKHVLSKSDYMAKFDGEMMVALGSKTGESPDIVLFTITEKLNELFGYSISSDNGVSTFTIYDIHSLGENSLNPAMFDLGVDARYDNPFNFPIHFYNASMRITDKESEEGWGTYSFPDIGAIESKGNLSIYAVVVVEPDEIATIVSLLLNGTTDVFYLRNLTTSFSIGNITIHTHRLVEVAHSDLAFELNIVRIGPSFNGVSIDIELVVPCNLTFNITYVYLQMYVAGTNNDVITIDQVIDTGEGKLLCLPYTTTEVKNLILSDVDYATIVQYLSGTFDLIGYIDAECYNYDGRIYFGSYDVEIISS